MEEIAVLYIVWILGYKMIVIMDQRTYQNDKDCQIKLDICCKLLIFLFYFRQESTNIGVLTFRPFCNCAD